VGRRMMDIEEMSEYKQEEGVGKLVVIYVNPRRIPESP
jgi:hypothetical protein